MNIWHLVIILAALLPGCATAPADDLAPTATQTTSARSVQQLMDAFKEAHEKRDLAAVSRLVYWEGTDADTKKTVEGSISADFGLPVKRIFVEKLPADEKLEYEMKGVTYRPNLAPVGRMNVEFITPPGGQLTAQTSGYLIGVKDGTHFIVTATAVNR